MSIFQAAMEPPRQTRGIATTLVVDAHPLHREALSDLVRKCVGEEHVTVVAANAEDGLRLCAQHPSLRLIMLDQHLPGISGVEAIGPFRRAAPSASIVMLTASTHARDIDSAARAGATAVAAKTIPVKLLADLLRRVFRHRPSRCEILIDSAEAARANTPAASGLSERQRAVLALLREGNSNKEIARCLGLAEITVKIHVSSILKELGVRNRTQAALVARQLGPLPEPIA